MRDAVSDWQALSALYEKADTLDEPALEAWLGALRREDHPLVEPLLQMLGARLEVRGNGFLGTLPRLPPPPEPTAIQWQAGSRVGAYRMLKPVGSGGMAEVWMAERDDGAFRRTVAIKLLFRHAGGADRDGFAQRFDRERDILASLHHPNIAGLYDAGVTPVGQPWLALEYVEGEPITSWCARTQRGVRERVELFRQVLFAVQHAHANLVIHRDLKPANILVTTHGEVRLLDFGIAKLMEAEGGALADTELTRHAGRLMTLNYASPEQLTGQPLTTATDVYSLGVVLYELLCGALPYEVKSGSAAQMEQAILDVEPRAPSRRAGSSNAEATGLRPGELTLRKAIGNDLDAIVLRALAKRPADRYGSVEALRVELDRWLAGEPVEARTPSTVYRLRRFAGRHLIGVSLGAAAVVSLIAAAGIAIALGLQARQESARATAARDFMMGMFKQADTDKSRGADVTARELLDRGRDDVLRRLGAEPALQADLLEGIAGIQSSMGEFTKADLTFDALVNLYERQHDARHAEIALSKRADNALQMGDYPLTRRLIAQAKTTSPVFEEPATRIRLSIIAAWLSNFEGNSRQARDEFQNVLVQSEKALGPTAPESLTALLGLVRSNANLKDFDAALANQHELVRRQLEVPSKTDLDVIDLDVNDAELLYLAGRYDELLRRERTTSPNCVTALGSSALRCRRLMLVGAAARLWQGSIAESPELLRSLQESAFDTTSPDFQWFAKIMLYRALSQLGQLDKLPDLSNQLRQVADADAFSDADKGKRVRVLQLFAENSLRSGRLDDAELELSRAERLAPDSGDTVPPYDPIGTNEMLRGLLLLARGRPEQALPKLQACQSRESVLVGERHPLAALYSINVAEALLALKRVDEAATIIDRADPVLRTAFGAESPVYRRVRSMREDPSSSAGRLIIFN